MFEGKQGGRGGCRAGGGHGRGHGHGPMRRGPGNGHFSESWGGEPAARRGRRRVFSGDELRLLLLTLIADHPRHGYDLIREIEAKTNGDYAPSPGVVYPTLTMLADMDLIAAQGTGEAKRTFEITPAGAQELTDNAVQVAAILTRLDQLSAHRARHQGGPVRRAMGNLRQVLISRIEAGAAEPEAELLHAITDILDEAARKIERL